MAKSPLPIKPLLWVASSKRDYMEFPVKVQEAFGFELYLAQTGQHPPSAMPLKGLGGGIIELRDAHDGDAYRAVYTVRFKEAVYVLHAFKKKAKRGIATPAHDIAVVERRMKDAQADYAIRFKREKP